MSTSLFLFFELLLIAAWISTHEIAHYEVFKIGCTSNIKYEMVAARPQVSVFEPSKCQDWVWPVQAINDIVGYSLIPMIMLCCMAVVICIDKNTNI
jgi:hypothetical protein